MASSDPKIEMLKSIQLFSACGPRDLERVAKLVDEVDVPDGHVIMRQGEPGTEMFIVVSGKATATRDGHQINEFGPGAVFGEMSLIAEGPRTATVTAEGPLRALVVGHREFHSLMEDHSKLRMRVLEGLADKVRRIEENAAH
ncbi:MAG TPA: cyclic nucleotide-binding domain-containing protein [Candidatus Binatus sp.]|nr:cyclic nucleotide-binding domain-containing protein [Candidatus Dormibacteraeota bacterium]HYL40782.1 cyclic nucleotide-binding domain-containing protein [Candidatus Binatus sp.]